MAPESSRTAMNDPSLRNLMKSSTESGVYHTLRLSRSHPGVCRGLQRLKPWRMSGNPDTALQAHIRGAGDAGRLRIGLRVYAKRCSIEGAATNRYGDIAVRGVERRAVS